MKKTIFLGLTLCFFCSSLLAQKNINSYKYVFVPNQFNFQKSADSYQVNSLTKFLFQKAGFTTFLSNEAIPEDLARNRCLALNVVMNKRSSLLSTKLNIDLVDCNNSVVFSTKDCQTREKDYKKAYHEAVRAAFKDIQALNYMYDSSLTVESKPNVVEKNITNTTKEKPIESVQTEVEPVVEKEVVEAIEEPVESKKEIVAEREIIEKSNEKSIPVVPIPIAIGTIGIETNKIKSKDGLEGTFNIGIWGECRILKSGENYDVIGVDENFVYANIYKTSKSNLYIIKWEAYKEPRLLELNEEGDLNVDTEKGKKIYKRLD